MKKLLLDENLPVRLKFDFPEDKEILTVNDMKWNSMKNGELLKAMEINNFDVLISSDQNLIYQQNINKYSMNFIIIKAPDNRYETVSPLIPKVISKIKSGLTEKVTIIIKDS
jgi:predicted nuclease of predicted toxin-antitoxin system